MHNLKSAVLFLAVVSLSPFAAGAGVTGGGGGASGGGAAAHGSGGSGGGVISGGRSAGTGNGGGGSVGVQPGRSSSGGVSITPPTATPGSPAQPVAPSRNGNTNPGNEGRHHEHNDRQSYPYGYGYPYSPFAGGYGYGGDGYGNNGIANTNYNNATLDNGPSNTVSGDQSTSTTPQVTPTDPNASAMAARNQNSIAHSPQLLEAQSDVQKAQQEYDAARQRVLDNLKSDPAYQKALQDRHAAASVLRPGNPTGGPISPLAVSAAESKLQKADAVTKMEQSALDQDPAASAAKIKLTDAMTKLSAIRGSGAAR